MTPISLFNKLVPHADIISQAISPLDSHQIQGMINGLQSYLEVMLKDSRDIVWEGMYIPAIGLAILDLYPELKWQDEWDSVLLIGNKLIVITKGVPSVLKEYNDLPDIIHFMNNVPLIKATFQNVVKYKEIHQ